MTASQLALEQSVIQVAQRAHVGAIVALHVAYIADNRADQIELDFLRAYYGELLKRSDSVVHVALLCGQVIGYASLVKSQNRALAHLVFSQPALSFRLVPQLLVSRDLFKRIWSRFAGEFLGAKWAGSLNDYEHAAELRSVVVDPNFRAAGLGTRLLQSSRAYIRQQRWGPVIAWIAADNVLSLRAFEKAGFTRVGMKTEAQRPFYLYLWDSNEPVKPKIRSSAGG